MFGREMATENSEAKLKAGVEAWQVADGAALWGEEPISCPPGFVLGPPAEWQRILGQV